MQTTWFKNFSKKIADLLPLESSFDADKLARLNPDHIQLENVRALLGVSRARAQSICDTAVRRGVFRRKIQILCPDNAVALTLDFGAPLPPDVRCRQLVDGHYESNKHLTAELRKVQFYCLND